MPQNKVNIVVATVTLGLVAVMLIAIARQDFSWWVIPFIILFGTIFTSVLWLCFLVYREDKFRKSAMWNDPDRPWLWDERWRSDTIPSRSKAEFWGNLAFFVILSMFALMSVAQILDKLPKGNFWTLLGLIPMAAAVLFGRNLYLSWIVLRYERQISFELETRPAWIGSTLNGRLHLPQRFQLDRSEVFLEHSRVVRQEDHDGVSFHKIAGRKLAGQFKPCQNEDGKFTAKVQIDIPEGSPETSWGHKDPRGWWDAVFALSIEGHEIQLRYEVPVAKPEKNKSNHTESHGRVVSPDFRS